MLTMDQKQLLKQMIEFNQATFSNTFKAMTMLQDQFERVAQTALDQANWLPEEGRKAIENWVEAFKTGQTEFKKYVDESYKKVESYFSEK
jgi:hypothetical protein